MPAPRNVHRVATAILSAAMAVIGALMLVGTFARGGEVFDTGVLLGVLFLLAGGGRLYLTIRSDG